MLRNILRPFFAKHFVPLAYTMCLIDDFLLTPFCSGSHVTASWGNHRTTPQSNDYA